MAIPDRPPGGGLSPFAWFTAASLGSLSKPQIPNFINKSAAEEEQPQVSFPITRVAGATGGAKETTGNINGNKADLRSMAIQPQTQLEMC